MLSESHMDSAKLAQSWKPFTCGLGEAGIAKGVLRAPTIKKLEAAGFTSLLDVRCPWLLTSRTFALGLFAIPPRSDNATIAPCYVT
jgi:hypothetical protein